ncbi:urease accessory protein UreF [Gelidibacter salicanalis]|uniref:Urease accessory protein UreF n=1 Tax=Gelidibacter salicanalis TaxID=291193 RepID=A0A5C7AQ30_9FLAO|nr:urease accessory protein UreF [Gelidibacter salicanalis]TXE10491.1 urease accessory protein UreF [Gelidibacter salicanalis]
MNKITVQPTALGSLIKILHITDPTLPIGGFSHSNGLETYVQQNLVKNASSTQDFVESMLKNNYKFNDGLAVKLAYDFTLKKNLNEILKLDNECNALKAPLEIREGSQKLGIRLIKIYAALLDDPFLNEINKRIEQKKMQGHYSVIFGIVTSILKIDAEKAVCAFLYNAAVGMVTNAVKLVPLGQTDGQHIIHNVEGLIETLTLEILELNRDMLGVCNTALDIKCMQHEYLYSRLYMS